MKHYFILLLLFCACTVSAQNNRPIRLGVGVYPNFSNAAAYNRILRSSTNHGKWFVAPTFFAEKELSTRWGCRVGIQYQNIGYRTPETNAAWPSEFATGQYVPNPLLPRTLIYDEKYSFLAIPIDFVFKIKKSKPFFVTAGYTPIINLNAQSTVTYFYLNRRTEISEQDINLKTFSVGLNLGIGRTFTLSEHWALDIQPTFRVVQLYSQLSYKRLYDTGIWFGIKRK